MRKVKLSLDRRSVDGLITYARGVRDGFNDNADVFASLPVTITAFNTSITELQAAQTATLLGGKPSFALRDAKRLVVENHLREYANYVENVALGDVSVIYLAGMEPKRIGQRNTEALQAPHNVRTSSRLTGTVKVLWKKVSYGGSYEVEYTQNPLVEDSWKRAATSNAGSAVVSGLTRTQEYWFRVRAIGAKGLVSNWSDPSVQLVS